MRAAACRASLSLKVTLSPHTLSLSLTVLFVKFPLSPSLYEYIYIYIYLLLVSAASALSPLPLVAVCTLTSPLVLTIRGPNQTKGPIVPSLYNQWDGLLRCNPAISGGGGGGGGEKGAVDGNKRGVD